MGVHKSPIPEAKYEFSVWATQLGKITQDAKSSFSKTFCNIGAQNASKPFSISD